ncbi:thioredoxin-like domain-containing protein [Frigoriglobus tundricola]|uniref:Thioredoxin domain-containing protein n=1 Tax=Frigoriglobus tundricola TaxID=2774151 RepID=A0A6M5YP60_9BACT|nr:redoxin domain-containing protein [Frigoriglobus tundricola]QJW95126.1 hypothetical protein FTUN_2665 [Frigoriglobus tundricola]
MRRAGAGLIAAVLALAGCKGTDSKSSDDRSSAGVASRNKLKDKDKDKDKDGKAAPTNLSWLDDGKLPGAGSGVPKSTGPWVSPGDPGFNAKAEAQDAIGGRVFDTYGKPARNIFIGIEEAGVAPSGPATMGIYTDNNGYFFTRGLKPGKAYDLTAKASQQNGKALVGVVQTLVPNPTLTIELRDDLPLPPGSGAPAPRGPSGAFPPLPKPSDRVGESGPPAGTPPAAQKSPTDGSYAPSAGPIKGVPPATLDGPKPAPTGGGTGALPDPDDLSLPPAPKPARPENVVEGPKDPNKAPPASIPNPNGGPPVPPVPALPPSFAPSGGGGRSAMSTTTGSTPAKFALIDSLDRTWSLDSVPPGSLVLIEFVTSTCEHSQRAVPILKDLQAKYGANGLQIAGVMCDDLPQKDRAATAAKYSRDYNLNYALFVEPGVAGTVRDRFDVQSYPHAVLLDATGKVLWKGHPGKKTELEAAIKQNLGK